MDHRSSAFAVKGHFRSRKGTPGRYGSRIGPRLSSPCFRQEQHHG